MCGCACVCVLVNNYGQISQKKFWMVLELLNLVIIAQFVLSECYFCVLCVLDDGQFFSDVCLLVVII